MTDQVKLSTERLELRLIEYKDLESIHALHSLPETDQYNALGIPDNIEDTRKIIQSWLSENQVMPIKNYTFAMMKRFDQEFIGLFGLKLGHEKYKRAEVWFKIHSDFWNQGFASEALQSILQYGFETLQLHRIEAGCAVGNIGSIKVLEKAGMTREGRGRKILPLKTGWSDNFEYAILDEDWGS